MSSRRRVDPVVSGLTSSQKKQIVAVYGGGQSQSGGKWEPIPVLTHEQIQLVIEEQRNTVTQPHERHRPHTSHLYTGDQRYDYKLQHPTGAAGMSREVYQSAQPDNMVSGRTGRFYSTSNEFPIHSPQYPSTTRPPLASSYPLMSQPSHGYPTPIRHSTCTAGHGQFTQNLTSTMQSLSIKDADCNYVIMVIGVTGSGKSTACNFFCGQDVFNTKGGAVSVTTKSEAHKCYILDKKVLLIDTPGFSDAYESEEQRMTDLGKALYYAHEGVHAIVICFNGAARFDIATESVVNALDQLGTFWPHAFILYTHADDMGNNESEQRQQIFQWLSDPRCPDRLKWLLKNVQCRFVTVESRMRRRDNTYRQQKCREFLGMVEQVYNENHCQLYTNKLFMWAKEKYDQAKREKMEQEEKLKTCQESLLEHQELLKSFEEQSIKGARSQEEAIHSLQQEIKSLQQQLQHQPNHSQEQDELYQQLTAKQSMEQVENRKLKEMLKEQHDTIELLWQTQNKQKAEEKILLQSQDQSVMEQCIASMKEEMREIQAQNLELKKEMSQVSHYRPRGDEDDDYMTDIIKGVGGITKGVGKAAALYVTSKCTLM